MLTLNKYKPGYEAATAFQRSYPPLSGPGENFRQIFTAVENLPMVI